MREKCIHCLMYLTKKLISLIYFSVYSSEVFSTSFSLFVFVKYFLSLDIILVEVLQKKKNRIEKMSFRKSTQQQKIKVQNINFPRKRLKFLNALRTIHLTLVI